MKPIWRFGVLSSNRGDQAITDAIEDLIRSKTHACIAQFSCKHELLDDRRIEQLNREASMLLIGGSGLYSNYPLESGWYFRCKPNNFKKIKVPIVLFAIGCNNHLEHDRFGALQQETLRSMRMINEQAVLSGVRDYRTLAILHDLGVSKACFTPDPTMFLKPVDFHDFDGDKVVGLSVAQHCMMLQQYRPLLLKVFARLCWFLDEQGFTPIFISHDCLEHSLYSDLEQRYPHLLCFNEDKPREMMSLYQQCVFTVGVRCHSNILSFGANTPFVSLMYDQKQAEFLKVVGLPELGIPIGKKLTFNRLVEKVDYVIDNRIMLKNRMEHRKCELRMVEDTFITRIVEVLREC